MTFTVDDLVASFNSGGHIGQEAIDIANLQAQLAQTLSYAQQQQQQYAASSHKLCNTPTTARTPTTSFGNWSAFEQQQLRARSRSASIAADGGMDTVNEDTEMEMDADEELAVEQLLTPSHVHTQTLSSPMRCRGRGDSFFAQQNYAHNITHSHAPSSPSHTRHPSADPMSLSDSTSPVSSIFTTADPFFAAATAEVTSQSQQSSFFAQIGRPSQQSPFYAAAQTSTGNATPQNQFTAPRFVSAGTVDS